MIASKIGGAVKTAGFSLLEVVIAAAVVMAATASLAPLFVVSADAARNAKAASVAVLLAGQKMEQLRSLGPSSLDPAPSGTLSTDTPGYVDYLDAAGAPLGAALATPPAGATYIRRWSIDPLPGSASDAIVLQVWVGHSGRSIASSAARLVSVKTKKASQ